MTVLFFYFNNMKYFHQQSHAASFVINSDIKVNKIYIAQHQTFVSTIKKQRRMSFLNEIFIRRREIAYLNCKFLSSVFFFYFVLCLRYIRTTLMCKFFIVLLYESIEIGHIWNVNDLYPYVKWFCLIKVFFFNNNKRFTLDCL